MEGRDKQLAVRVASTLNRQASTTYPPCSLYSLLHQQFCCLATFKSICINYKPESGAIYSIIYIQPGFLLVEKILLLDFFAQFFLMNTKISTEKGCPNFFNNLFDNLLATRINPLIFMNTTLSKGRGRRPKLMQRIR